MLLAGPCDVQRGFDKTLRPHPECGVIVRCTTEQGVALLQEALAILAHLHKGWLQAGNTTVDQQSSAGRSAFNDVQRAWMERHGSKIGGELVAVFGLLPIDHETASTGREGNSQFTLPLQFRGCH